MLQGVSVASREWSGRDGACRVLPDVRHLVYEQPEAGPRLGTEASAGKEDVSADGDGVGAVAGGEAVGVGVGVEADGAEVGASLPLQARPQDRRERKTERERRRG